MPNEDVLGLCGLLFYYLFIYLFINLFIWVRPILVAVRGLLSSCGAWALERAGSVVAAFRLSCPAACGILVP